MWFCFWIVIILHIFTRKPLWLDEFYSPFLSSHLNMFLLASEILIGDYVLIYLPVPVFFMSHNIITKLLVILCIFDKWFWIWTFAGPDDMPAHIKSSMFGCTLAWEILPSFSFIHHAENMWLCYHLLTYCIFTFLGYPLQMGSLTWAHSRY